MRIDGEATTIGFDNMSRRRVTGTTEWQKYSVVLDVPAKATKICFGVLQQGTGTTWADDLQLTLAAETDKPTGSSVKLPVVNKLTKPTNTDFETASGDRPASWGGGGAGYELSVDRDDPHGGKASGHIRSVQPSPRFASMTQGFLVGEFAGKKVKYTGYLKTKDAERSGLWMRVDGEAGGKRTVLSFDNMQTRPVTGTTDWTRYTVTLDVPADAVSIAYGFLLIGTGEVWADDLQFEAVGPLAP